MFSMPLQKISKRLRDIANRTHNQPEEMRNAAIAAEIEHNWQEVMGKAESYVQGSDILAQGGWFSTMSLGNWLTICEAAGVEAVPTRLGAVIDTTMVFDISQNGLTDRRTAQMQDFLSGFQDIGDTEIVRFDTSAPAEVKAAMTLGRDTGETPAWRGYTRNENGVVFPHITDDRLVARLMENPENTSPVWIREWVAPVMMTGCRNTGWQRAVVPAHRLAEGEELPEGDGDLFPCEWRVYVKNGEITAVSNYYTAIDRGLDAADEAAALAVAEEIIDATQRVIATLDSLGAIPHHPQYEHRDGFDADAIHFSLDFMEVADADASAGRRPIMLEGGPAHLRNPAWGAHPCCFGPERDPGEPGGLALSADDIRPLPTRA